MNKTKWLTSGIMVCLLASVCCAFWGSAFPFIKIGYSIFGIEAGQVSKQILFAGVRFTLSGIMTLAIGSVMTRKLLLPTVTSVKKILNLSMVQTVIQYVFFYVGLSHTSGVKASIIEGMNVFISLLVASFLFRQERLTGLKILGCVIGFLGVIIVNVNSGGLQMSFSFLGEGFILMSTVAYAFSSVLLKHYTAKENAVMLSGYQFICGGLIMTLTGWLMGGRMQITTVLQASVLLYLAAVSAIAYGLWGILLKYNSVSTVSVYGFMTPVFGVFLSALLLKEHGQLGVQCLIALLLVSVGIYIVNRNGSSAGKIIRRQSELE